MTDPACSPDGMPHLIDQDKDVSRKKWLNEGRLIWNFLLEPGTVMLIALPSKVIFGNAFLVGFAHGHYPRQRASTPHSQKTKQM